MRMLDGLSSSGCWVFKDNLKCAERDEAKTVMCNLESDVIQGILYSSLQINVSIICCHKSHLDFMYTTITHNDTELDSRLHSTHKVHHISIMMPTRTFKPYVIVEPRYGFCCGAIKSSSSVHITFELAAGMYSHLTIGALMRSSADVR